jgi:hypothetical protein
MKARRARRWRVVLYGAALLLASLCDWYTVSEMASWSETLAVWVASLWGTMAELRAVAAAATLTMLVELWISPGVHRPLWMDALNRLLGVCLVWLIVHAASGRMAARKRRLRAAVPNNAFCSLLPICACCKAIRAENGDWHRLEAYFAAHSGVSFTHTYCPACAAKLYSRSSPA